jgi:brefeldin A-inhibited guanine nucleotide-exchange protein
VKGDGIDPKGGPGFYVRILHHYADACLTGMMFDDAIRLFLSGFRLPGEANRKSTG